MYHLIFKNQIKQKRQINQFNLRALFMQHFNRHSNSTEELSASKNLSFVYIPIVWFLGILVEWSYIFFTFVKPMT